MPNRILSPRTAMFFVSVMPLVAAISSNMNWPIRRMSNVSGDIMLGALFPIHERNAKYECGRLQVSINALNEEKIHSHAFKSYY